jgi:hypothetical protein
MAICTINAQPGAGDGLGKAVPLFERQHLTGSFYLYHSFSVINAQPLSFTLDQN